MNAARATKRDPQEIALWLDAMLSPALASWISQRFRNVSAVAVRTLGHASSTDAQIFGAARAARAVVMTKDADFVVLLDQRGPPPQVIWLTLGNTSDKHLRDVLDRVLVDALDVLARGEPLVEIRTT